MAEDFFGRKRIKKKPSSQLWSIPDRQPIYFTVEDNELVTSKRKSRIPKKKSLALANNGSYNVYLLLCYKCMVFI